MKPYRIFTKLFLSHAGVLLITILLLAFIFYAILEQSLIQRTVDQLTSVNLLKKQMVENYFLKSQKGLKALDLEEDFLNLFKSLQATDGRENEKAKQMQELLTFFDVENFMVVDTAHTLLYSSTAFDLPLGLTRYMDSLMELPDQHFEIVDASPFTAHGNPQLFYFIPVVDEERALGYVLIEENLGKVQHILYDTVGMGSTGESYLVARDKRMRSASRFFPEQPPVHILVDTKAVQYAFNNISGEHIIKDYRDVNVLSAYRLLRKETLPWVIISEMDYDEALTPILQLRYYLVTISLVLLFFTMAVTFFISGVIARPIVGMRNMINSLSRGVMPKLQSINYHTAELNEMVKSMKQLVEGMKRTSAFANEIGAGNFEADFEPLSDEDTLGKSLLNMRNELHDFNEREVRLIRERSAALMEGQEKERKRTIQELHDGVGQLLIALKMQTEMISGNDTLKKELSMRINELIKEVRRISYNVMPNALVDYGLEAALRGLCENVKSYTSLHIEFTFVREVSRQLSFDVTISVFRIMQEGLNNIVKHAAATEVKLFVVDNEFELYLLLEDNGKGFDENALKPNVGVGLQSMKDRASLLNGTLHVYAKEGQGTSLEVRIPISLNS